MTDDDDDDDRRNSVAIARPLVRSANYTLHRALSVNCRVNLKVVLTARRIVIAINLADESTAFQARAAASPHH